ncbi:MAG: hypothetical protein ABS76_15625 [Pelagibacterium sp. SCN 64-44]|nr:MAG: hypothetical protein ABS76_15625 [Pelagibacterium sp. SCN 64-44]
MKAASLAAGQGDTFVRDMLARDREPGIEKFTALARALGTTVGALVDDGPVDRVVPVSGSEASILVAGKVAAGVFLEVDDFDQSEPERIYEPLDPQFPNARRMAFEVEGDSMNDLKPRPILEGDRLICVSFEDVADQVRVRDGLIVVVERTRDGGHTREWSVKQVELYEDRFEFHPRSTNPRHKPIVVKRDATADDGVQVEIIGLVRAVRNEFPL